MPSQTDISTETLSEVHLQKPWNVIVHNDPVNLMQYVVRVFMTTLGMTKEKAVMHMMQVHKNGRSIVWTGDHEKAEYYMYQLQKWHLTVSLEVAP
jgi:ATP-dependent Clp protease adaptor protein ClpS